MRHFTPPIVVLATVLVLSSACGSTGSGDDVEGSGTLVTETFDLGEFQRIDIGNAFDADITIGDTTSVVVETDDNVVEYLDVEVEDGALRLRLDDVSLRDATLQATIVTPVLGELDTSGAARARIGPLTVDSFDLETSGASTIILDSMDVATLRVDMSGASTVTVDELDADEADLEVSGASRITAAGVTTDLELDVSGASTVGFANVQVESADVDVSGASTVDVRGASLVTGEVDGASTLRAVDEASTDVDVGSGSRIES